MADYRGAGDFYNPSASWYRLLRPFVQNNHRFIGFGVRAIGPPEAMKDSIRKTMALLAPNFALSELATVPEILKNEIGFFTFLRRLLLEIAVLGLLLASIGIYGVVAALVSERTREVGIRMALGANPKSVVWLFLKSGVRLSVIGAALGLAASLELQNVLARMLPVLPGKNPSVLIGMVLLLVAIAIVASFLPALRATKCDPLVALRAE